MRSFAARRRVALGVALAFMFAAFPPAAPSQSRRQQPAPSQQKKNRRDGQQQPPAGNQPNQEPTPPDIVGSPQDEVVSVRSTLVNVDAVVYNKKTRQIVTGLKRENFAVFEDGVQKEITNFSTPDAPITVALVLEYSKMLDNHGGDRFEPGRYEVLKPAAMFLTQFVQPPNDYASVIAYDNRATPLTDFTNDPNRLQTVINLLFRSYPASSEANLFDAMNFVLMGGRGDAVVLDNSRERKAEYGGLAGVQGRRRAMILICSGFDTFSKINYGNARKIAQNAGVPIYIIGTGNLFFKKYGDQMSAEDGLLGSIQPGRMSFLQAQNALKTFAKETGGAYFPVTFDGELPGVLNSINALLRNQYSLGYNPGDVRDGKQHKLTVRVDVNGDGQFDDKEFIVNARQFYNAPKG